MSEQKLVEQPNSEKPLLPRQPEVNIGTAGHVDHGKCLRWDEYVLLNGMPMTGAEIQNLVAKRGRLLSTLDGAQVYEFEDSSTVSLGRDFEPVESRALFYVQAYRGPLYDIRTRTGRTISVTPEHPLLANRKGRIVWLKAKELSEGDYISFLSRVPLAESVQFPNPIPKLREKYELVTWEDCERLRVVTDGFRNLASLDVHDFERLRTLARLSNSQFCRIANVESVVWRDLLHGTRVLDTNARKRLIDAFRSVELESLRPGEFLAVQKSGPTRRIRKLKEIELDTNLVKWLAFVWSEGSSTANRIGVTHEVQLGMLSEYLEISKTFNLEVKTYSRGHHEIFNSAFVDYLRHRFGFVPGNKYKSPISGWICRIPRSMKALFLRWFLTLDGEFNKKSGQLSISQANERNIVTLAYLLSSFGIVPRFDRVRRKVKSGKREYSRLSVSGRRNLELFAEYIGFEDPAKHELVVNYLRKLTNPSKETNLVIPVDSHALRSLLSEIGLCREAFRPNTAIPTMKHTTWYKAYEGARRTGGISRAKLLLILEAVQEHLDRIDSSRKDLSHHQDRLREHLELIGASLEGTASEIGTSRKRLTRIMRRGRSSERAGVVEAVQRLTVRLVRESMPLVEQLRLLSSSPLEFDRITELEAQEYEGQVYDMTVPGYANFIAGGGAIVSHNSTLTQSITGVWTSAHSEELRRGITIKVGYADAAFYRCPETPAPAGFCTSPVCPVCGRATKLLRAVSFVDCPGHESLMTNMLAGAFLMDGTILVIAANEGVPQPQTREHLLALQMLGMKKIVIAQNKIDLVTDEEAKKNREAIESFVSKTVAADAPVIPISAQQKLNIDALIEAIEEVIPTPKRDPGADPLMYVVRSFDVNKPGMEIRSLSGGVLGGSLVKGELRVGEEVEVRPGMIDERSGKFAPIVTKVASLQTGAGTTEKVGPGGLVAVGTHLDPTFTKGDQMVGSVIGKPGTLPPTWEHITLDLDLFETAVGSAEMVKVDKVRPGENLRLNLGTSSSPAVVTSARNDVIEVDLKKSVAIEAGMRVAVSRRIAERWRLIGSGLLK